MILTFLSLINLIHGMDLFILTDGSGGNGSTSRLTVENKTEWRRAKEWTEFLFHASGILDYSNINAHFISR